VFGPRTWRGWPSWAFPSGTFVWIGGAVLMLGGGCLATAGLLKLGVGATGLQRFAAGAGLQQSGAFCVVRHPMYCGMILAAFGWALIRQGWLTLGYAALLSVLLDLKSQREEERLLAKFPEYASYRQRVCKFIPFVY
jgi:protein-S-isoprenylcysteine O-methyltransferase Ste14